MSVSSNFLLGGLFSAGDGLDVRMGRSRAETLVGEALLEEVEEEEGVVVVELMNVLSRRRRRGRMSRKAENGGSGASLSESFSSAVVGAVQVCV